MLTSHVIILFNIWSTILDVKNKVSKFSPVIKSHIKNGDCYIIPVSFTTIVEPFVTLSISRRKFASKSEKKYSKHTFILFIKTYIKALYI